MAGGHRHGERTGKWNTTANLEGVNLTSLQYEKSLVTSGFFIVKWHKAKFKVPSGPPRSVLRDAMLSSGLPLLSNGCSNYLFLASVGAITSPLKAPIRSMAAGTS